MARHVTWVAGVLLALACGCGAVVAPNDGGTGGGGGCPAGTVSTPSGCAVRKPPGQTCTAATECGSGYCVDGVCCQSSCDGPCVQCNAQGRCESVPLRTPEPACGAYVCGQSRCETSCSNNAQCQGDSHCDQGRCVATRGNSERCTAGDQCQSGFCADGVCCDKACTGACDACAQTGREGHCTVVAGGADGFPTCGAFVCDGAGASCPQGCSDDSVCAAGHYCNGTTCATKKATGTTCSGDSQCLSGYCVDGFCCGTACAGACDVCGVAGSEGTCRLEPLGSSGNPSCAPFTCRGDSAACPTSCATDFECASGRYCEAGGCLLQKAQGAACQDPNECQSGYCVDGACCNTLCAGQCDACNVTGKLGTCTLLPDGAGGTPSCAPYACNGNTANCGQPCTGQGDVAPCTSTQWCDGFACAAKQANGQACTQGYQCQSGACADGVCCDTACGGACDSCNQRGNEGTCKPEPAGAASAACGPYACDGTNSGCPSACTNDVQCVATNWCQGTACVQQLANGQTCTRNAACQSGKCVDGTCCNQVCGNACDRCDLPGQEGTCATAVAGTTPFPACGFFVCDGVGAGCPSSCVDDNGCRSTAFCQDNVCVLKRPTGLDCSTDHQCQSGFCADGYCCGSRCDGACDQCNVTQGTCTPMGPGSVGSPVCGAYLCDGAQSVCPNTCGQDSDCAQGYFCLGNACLQRKADGQVCTTANQCLSGFCADGVCCNTACSGACDACNINAGTCTARSAGSDGAPSCNGYVCDGQNVTCPSTCPASGDKTQGCAPTHYCEGGSCLLRRAAGQTCQMTTECQSGLFCADGVCCTSACSGPCDRCGTGGTCNPAPAQAPGAPTCFPYLCDGSGAGCPTTCAGDSDCESNRCDLNAGVCLKRQAGDACQASFECDSACCDATQRQCVAGPSGCL